MTVVIDASVAFAGLVGNSRRSQWAREVLAGDDVVAPDLMSVEVAHLLRKAVLSGELPHTHARDIVASLPFLVAEFLPHTPLLSRAWELHPNLTSYDATYVALAEALGAPLATIDKRLSKAPGPTCDFLVNT